MSVHAARRTPAFTLPAGVGKRLTATGTFSDLTTRDLTTSVVWTTSTPSVVTVSVAGGSSGLVTSVAPGTATIRATDAATAVAGSTVVTVSSAQLVSIAITPGRAQVGWGLCGGPELGLLLTIDQGLAIHVVARYEITTASFDVNGHPDWNVNHPSWFSAQVGFAFY